MEVCTLIRGESSDRVKTGLVYRHLAWINALRIQLRKQDHWEDLSPFLEAAEKEELLGKRNKATQLIHRQSKRCRSTLGIRRNQIDGEP